MDKLYVKVDGVWHQANDEQTETICGLDPQDVDDAREGFLPAGDIKRCPVCFAE